MYVGGGKAPWFVWPLGIALIGLLIYVVCGVMR